MSDYENYNSSSDTEEGRDIGIYTDTGETLSEQEMRDLLGEESETPDQESTFPEEEPADDRTKKRKRTKNDQRKKRKLNKTVPDHDEKNLTEETGNIGGSSDLQKALSDAENRLAQGIESPNDTAELSEIKSKTTENSASVGKETGDAPSHINIEETQTDPVFFAGCSVLPTPESFIFNSREEESIRQPEHIPAINPYIKEDPEYTDAGTSNIIGRTHCENKSIGNIGNTDEVRHDALGITTTGSNVISPDSHKTTEERAENKTSDSMPATADKEQLENGRRYESKIRKDFTTHTDKLINLASYTGNSMLQSSVMIASADKDETTHSAYEALNMVKDSASAASALMGMGVADEKNAVLSAMGLRSALIAMEQRTEAVSKATEKLGEILGKNSSADVSMLNGTHRQVMNNLKSAGIQKDTVTEKIRYASDAVNKAKEELKAARISKDEEAVRLADSRLKSAQNRLSEANRIKAVYDREQKSFRIIAKNRKGIVNANRVRSDLIEAAKASPNLFTKRQLEHLQSGDFINGAVYSRQNMAVLNAYFNKNQHLREYRPVSMKIKDIRRLIRHKDTAGITASEKRMLEMLIGLKKAEEVKKLLSLKNRLGRRLSGMKTVGRLGVRMLDRDETGSFRTIKTTIWGGRAAAKMLSFAARNGVKLAAFVTVLPRRYVRRKIETVKNIAKTQVKTARKALNCTFKASKPGRYAKRGIECASDTAFARKASKAVNNIKKTVNTSARAVRKTARRSSAVVRKAGSVIKKPFGVLFAPFRFLNEAARFIKGILWKIGLIFLGIAAVYGLLIILLSFLFETGSEYAKTAASTPMMNNEDMEYSINRLNALNDEKYKEALEVAKGKPMHPEVYGGEKIYHYGSPEGRDDPNADIYHNDIGGETDNGYHIYFIDSKGSVIGSNTTNTKDIIAMASVMFGNQLYREGSKQIYPEYRELIEKWSDLLNPEVVYLESDIYHAEGSDVFPHGKKTSDQKTYYCNDADFYASYHETQHQTVNGQSGGVKFYEEPHEQTTNGCMTDYEAFAGAYQDWQDSEPIEPEEPDRDDYVWMDEPDYDDYQYYEDYSSDYDDYRDQVEEYEEAYDRYLEDWDDYYDAHIIWRDSEPVPEDYKYCPGHPIKEEINCSGSIPGYGSYTCRMPAEEDLACSYGYKDINIFVTVLTKEDVYEAFQANNGIINYRVPKEYDLSSWEKKTVDLNPTQQGYEDLMTDFLESDGWKNTHNTEWADALFDNDWYEIFGVDVYSDSVGLNDGSGGLSPKQIEELIDSYDGEMSADREDFIEFALTYVGQIDYYYGGKARNRGFSGNGFGERVGADKKGRTLRGLDCSGFVSWVYWSVFGVKPGMSTANFASSLNLRRTTADRLIPGDIGYMNLPGSDAGNHIGIFVGYDDTTGKAKWVHCSGQPKNTVVCNTTNCFRYYYSLGK